MSEQEHEVARLASRRFRKRPVVIEAVRLTWPTWNEICDFVDVGDLADGKPQGCYVLPDGSTTEENQGDASVLGLHIPTLEGLMLATEGDWVIKGVQGEFYPCKPDIFEATYEEVESP